VTGFEGGLSVQLPSGLSLTVEGAYDGIGDSDFEASGGSVTLAIPLQRPARLPPG
jgi:hypothetical protein